MFGVFDKIAYISGTDMKFNNDRIKTIEINLETLQITDCVSIQPLPIEIIETFNQLSEEEIIFIGASRDLSNEYIRGIYTYNIKTFDIELILAGEDPKIGYLNNFILNR